MDKKNHYQQNAPLFIAVCSKDINKVREFLKSGADVNVESDVNVEFVSRFKGIPYTPLMIAAEQGYLEIVEELLKSSDIDVNVKNYYGKVALHMACEESQVEVVKRLLAVKGIDVNVRDRKYGFSPLMSAPNTNNAEIVQILLCHPSIEINLTDEGGKTALHRAASSGHEETVIILLKDPRVSVNLQDTLHGHTALHLATDFHHNEVVRHLLNHPNIDVNVQDVYGQTALHTSAYHGNLEVVEMLLESGIDATIKTKAGFTAVYWAGKQNKMTVVKMITEHIQRMNDQAKLGKTLRSNQRTKGIQVSEDTIGYYEILPVNEELLQAADIGDSEKVKYLMKQPGIDVNSVDQNKNTPLHLSAERGHEGVVKVLLESEDINVNAKNLDRSKLVYPVHPGDDPNRAKLTSGKAALWLAVKNGHFDVVRLLVNHKEIDVNTKDKYGESCLHSAVTNNFNEVAKLLLNHIKINPNEQDPSNDHYTALHTAIEKENMEIIGALLNHPDIDLNLKEKFRQLTPLEIAVKNNFLTAVEIILPLPKVDTSIMNKQNLLYFSVKNGKADIVKLLLKVGVKIEDKVLKLLSSVNMETKINPTIVQMISDYKKENTNAGPRRDLSASKQLLTAAQNGDFQKVQELLKRGSVDVNHADKNQNTCLHLAAERGHLEIVRELLKRSDIDVNAKNKDDSKYIYPIYIGDDPARGESTVGKSALFCAVMGGHLEVVKLLVNHYKIDINVKDKYDKSCLYVATFKGFGKILQALLRHPKIDVNAKCMCYDHTSPLHIAVEQNRSEIVADLLSHPNIDVNIKDRLHERTPLHIAANYGYLTPLKLLMSKPNIDVNMKDKFGRTALQLAMENKHELFVQVLLNIRLPA